jgi:hypothetical protein
VTHRETEGTRSDRGALTNADSFESRNTQLTHVSPGPEVIFADGWDVAAQSVQVPAGPPNPEVIIVSEGNPVSDEALKTLWFEAFDVRRTKSFLEILVRLELGAAALLLSLASLGLVFLLVRSGPQTDGPKAGWTFALPVIFLAAIFVFLTLRHLLYWRVDAAGIHQYCLGLRNWTLPWTEIVSRQLGSPETSLALLGPIILTAILNQPMVLKDRKGHRRKVNRLATNADRLDGMVQVYVNPGRQAELGRRYARTIRSAQKTHAGTDPAHVLLHLIGRDSPVVRMNMHEPRLVPVCCNCLGTAAVRAPIQMSPGPIGFLFERFVRLMIPLCSDCHTRTRTSLPERTRGAVGLSLIMTGIVFVVVGLGVVSTILGLCCFVGGLQMVRLYLRRPTPDKLVRVVGIDPGRGWMDVRFGNSDYARLVNDLNTLNSDR